MRNPVLVSLFVLSALVRAVAPLHAEPKPGTVRVNPKDGAEMVYVPAGSFLMGSRDAEEVKNIGNPMHKVHLDGYWIYKTPVTVARYRRYCLETPGCSMPDPEYWGWIEDHPMMNVTWGDAAA